MSNTVNDIRDAAMASKAWPFEEARKILKRVEKNPAKEFVLFETGYGPSGLPHIGTFGEVARTSMIRHAFSVISDLPTRLICFSDDLDGMRKVPDNVPNAAILHENLHKPLTSVPDPFGEFESFGHHNNAMLRRFLDTFGFEYEFYSATEFYSTGQFDAILKRAAEKYDDIMAVMLKSLREERRQSYSIFLPISKKTGRVLYVPIKRVDAENGIITFDEDGVETTSSIYGGNVKLQWKPDFGARWAALDVDFEMYGKDHSTNTPIYDRICEILGGRKPEHFTYELFLDENGEKISKSKGNGLTIDEWLSYASTESLSYFMYQKPKTAKRMYFDVIPKAVDEYHQQLRACETQDAAARVNNPVYHIHNGNPPASDMAVGFAMLLNLASAAGTNDPSVLWGFINTYAPDASPEANPSLNAAVTHAIKYVHDFVEPNKTYRNADARERAALLDLVARFREAPDGRDGDALQSIVFAVGKEHGFDPLRDWFKALYEILLGASQGPRFGGFAALYGVNATIKMIEDALARE